MTNFSFTRPWGPAPLAAFHACEAQRLGSLELILGLGVGGHRPRVPNAAHRVRGEVIFSGGVLPGNSVTHWEEAFGSLSAACVASCLLAGSFGFDICLSLLGFCWVLARGNQTLRITSRFDVD